MLFEIDISKTMCSGGREFVLRSRFATPDASLVLFGPSGSGKSLTLQAVAGLLTPDAGRIAVDGTVLFDSEAGVNLPPRQRRVGLVFQDYALFPHLSVRANVAFGLKRLGRSLTRAQQAEVDKAMELVGVRELAGNRPAEISGGSNSIGTCTRS